MMWYFTSLSLLFQSVKEGTGTECSFWDQARDEGYGAWSTDGCNLVEEDYDKATCRCNHLTHFAIIRVSQKQVCAPSAVDQG